MKNVLFDTNTGLWIGSKKKGLFNLHQGQLRKYQSILNANIVSTIALDDNSIWVATEKGLHLLNKWELTDFYPFDHNKSEKPSYITAIVSLPDNTLLIGSRTSLFTFSLSSKEFKKIKLIDKDYIVFNIYEDLDNNIWVTTDKGIFFKESNKTTFEQYKPDFFNFAITSITSDKKNIWIGTLKKGLYLVSKTTDEITHLTQDIKNNNTLSSNYITSLLLDDKGILWVATFTGGVNSINTNTIKFGLHSPSNNDLFCAKSSSFNDFHQSENGTLYIASVEGFIAFNKTKNTCTNHFPQLKVNAITKENNFFWLATSQGLYTFNETTSEMTYVDSKLPKTDLLLSSHLNSNEILLGTINGLFIYNKDKDETTAISTNNLKFHAYAKDKNERYYFATNQGIAFLNDNNQLIFEPHIQSQLPNKYTLSLLINDDELYFGSFQGGLYKYNLLSKKLISFSSSETYKDLSIHSLLMDNDSYIWSGTDKGLKKVDFNNKHITHFQKSDGLQGPFFNINAAYKAPDGQLYFGGRNGFNAFYPQNIQTNKIPPSIVLTDFSRFGKSVTSLDNNDQFYLEKPINDLDKLSLTHKDYVIGFEFAALDMIDPSRNKYRYKLDGFDPDWTNVNADNRRANYTNLPSGDYAFQVAGSNNDGIWSTKNKSLNITVLPAPWLTWWAFSLYALAFFTLIYWYWHKKNRDNIRITKMLKAQVRQRTEQLEQLLVKKNEMFANVSHEFRTPLTLILGPINKLLKSPLHSEDKQSLKMVNRNANRLLTMIEQLLLLAKFSGEEKVTQVPQLIHHQVLSIVEIFKQSAQEKDINLSLLNNNHAAINVTPHTIDTLLGNLLSNAIKYTPNGGEVTVNSLTTTDGYICIEVKDSGCGLTEQQQKDIFNRFKRLDNHSDIDGVGIGLSIVEEVLKINNGQLSIESELNKGSTFRVKFATIEVSDDTDISGTDEKLILTNQLAKNALLQNTSAVKPQESVGHKINETILIIEDNDDMRQHIADSLKSHYHCLLANRGKAGIALAVKNVPDIIICDVMMPEMDGFKVSRILRSDTRTSHIPLILLTALHDKQSRIKGWREHVDAYLTKPFDADELLLQLSNVLVIRNILKKKTGQLIQAGKKSPENIDLQKKDKDFIDKLNDLIKLNYYNSIYQRTQLASDMAVSEKQLQRKTKALIDKNPMELLREYRLKVAVEKLKDGYQVSVVCDESGFNSLSHFSQCFKAHYGVTPKAYQQTCNNK